MKVEEVAKPPEKKEFVVLKVRAASVNPIDWKMRSGAMAAIFPMTFPLTLVLDCAGEGPGGALFAGVGDPRFDGTHAEFALLHEKNICEVPSGLDAAGAASLCVAGLSAYIPLVEAASLKRGQKLL